MSRSYETPLSVLEDAVRHAPRPSGRQEDLPVGHVRVPAVDLKHLLDLLVNLRDTIPPPEKDGVELWSDREKAIVFLEVRELLYPAEAAKAKAARAARDETP